MGSESVQDEIVRGFFKNSNYKSAQIYLDMLLQQQNFRAPEAKIRLLLMNSLAAGYSRDFQRAYRLLEEARNLLELSEFRGRFKYDAKARERIFQSIELLAYDLRTLEANP
jgi:hypothetical protein